MTCVSFLPASRIHVLFSLSTALRYSCCALVSVTPGKKSRAMMWSTADTYVSSSNTTEGRFILFGAGGGGISAVEPLRFVSAFELVEDMVDVWEAGRR